FRPDGLFRIGCGDEGRATQKEDRNEGERIPQALDAQPGSEITAPTFATPPLSKGGQGGWGEAVCRPLLSSSTPDGDPPGGGGAWPAGPPPTPPCKGGESADFGFWILDFGSGMRRRAARCPACERENGPEHARRPASPLRHSSFVIRHCFVIRT